MPRSRFTSWEGPFIGETVEYLYAIPMNHWLTGGSYIPQIENISYWAWFEVVPWESPCNSDHTEITLHTFTGATGDGKATAPALNFHQERI